MNTEFNILWFEDNDEWYEAIKDEIEKYIEDLCFSLKITRFTSILDEKLQDILLKNNFDLIFADLNLNNSRKGNEAIQLVRQSNVLADALFYSTDGVDKIKSVMQTDVLEGVYLCDRNEYLLLPKAERLIDKIVNRSEDIINIRGLLMDNVSEFDEKLKETIRKTLSISTQEEIRNFNTYAFDKVNKQICENKKKGG